ncbi:MAG TPA: branched-chain amino acid ABC transporter permease [Clostridia bacterium]|nr:branched-chain amino acid ABC transporter permease [Clostridia bacterium]
MNSIDVAMEKATSEIKGTDAAKKRLLLSFGSGEWLFGTSGKTSLIGSAIVLLVICFLDSFTPSRMIPTYFKHILVCSLIYAILALGLNFVSGYIGQTSLGHAAFFGIGAYATGVLTQFAHMNFWLTIPVAAVFAVLVSFLMAASAQRVRGSFLVVITYGFGEVLRFVCINTQSLGGSAGIPGIKAPTIFGIKLSRIGPSGKEGYILLTFIIVVAIAFFMQRMEKSRTGYAFAAIREDEVAAVAMGINTKYYKTLAIVVSAFICSVAGSVQAAYASFVSPELLSSTQSILILTIVIVGGARSIKGAILSAGLMTVVPELFHMVQDILGLSFDPWMILYGLILVVMMRFRPQGFWGKSPVK